MLYRCCAVICLFLLSFVLSACALDLNTASTPAPVTPALVLTPDAAPTQPAPLIVSPAPALVVTSTPEGMYAPMTLPDGARDELPLMQGICYEAARAAAGRTFILRNAVDHIRFYDEMDQAQVCRRPVTRFPFDFEGGRVLAGFWQMGRGCTARHEVQAITRDAAARTITVTLRFVAEGACDYELLRPFWISLPEAAGWQVVFVAE